MTRLDTLRQAKAHKKDKINYELRQAVEEIEVLSPSPERTKGRPYFDRLVLPRKLLDLEALLDRISIPKLPSARLL